MKEWKPKAMKILRHIQDEQHGTQRNEKRSRRRKTYTVLESKIKYEIYNKNLSAEEVRWLWKLSALSYENYQQKFTH